MAAGANAEAKDLRGHSPLHIAATCDADSVLALLKVSKSTGATNSLNKSFQFEIWFYVEKGGANPNATDLNGRTSLHCAVSRGISLNCIGILVDTIL